MSEEKKIPYKIYLKEEEMPVSWYNVRADMKNKPAPLLNPGTLQPLKFEEMKGIFCDELCRQELDDTPIVWRKSCRRRQKFIISSRETIPAGAISSTPPLPRRITQKSRGLRA